MKAKRIGNLMLMPHGVLDSLLKLLNVIRIDKLRKNGLVNIMKLE